MVLLHVACSMSVDKAATRASAFYFVTTRSEILKARSMGFLSSSVHENSLAVGVPYSPAHLYQEVQCSDRFPSGNLCTTVLDLHSGAQGSLITVI